MLKLLPPPVVYTGTQSQENNRVNDVKTKTVCSSKGYQDTLRASQPSLRSWGTTHVPCALPGLPAGLPPDIRVRRVVHENYIGHQTFTLRVLAAWLALVFFLLFFLLERLGLAKYLLELFSPQLAGWLQVGREDDTGKFRLWW